MSEAIAYSFDYRERFETVESLEDCFWAWKGSVHYRLWVCGPTITCQHKEDKEYKIQRSVGDPMWKVLYKGRYLAAMDTLHDANRLLSLVADIKKRVAEGDL